MSAWSALVPVAMVGAERQAPVVPPLANAPIGALLAQVLQDADSPALGLLRMAAVLATCAQAGAQGTSWSGPLPALAAPETDSTLDDPSAVLLLGWTLDNGPVRLQHLVLRTLAARRQRLPYALLPGALELGRRSLALRDALLPVLGERGRWLAAQNAAWNFATGAASQAEESVRWSDGNLAQRRELLRAERARDPAAGRERLHQAIGDLPARERAELLAELAVGLSPDDEALLDTLRRDRAREVRQTALGLLLRLPDSAFVRRATQRLSALLRQERHFLQKQWRLEAPSAASDDWKADGIETTRPKNETLGERAWWLYQLAGQVPPDWWSQHTGLSPVELVKWAIAGDWAEALLRAWRETLALAPDAVWCEALLDGCPRQLLPEQAYTALLALLPPTRRERYWEKQLTGVPALDAVGGQILAACPPGEWVSPSLSAVLVSTVAAAARQNSFLNNYAWRNLLPELCCVLHPGVLPALGSLPRHADETASLAEMWHTITQVVATRQAFNS